MKEKFNAIIDRHRKAIQDSFNAEGIANLDGIAQVLLETFRKGGKVLLCGNGGSAADAQHIAAEFIARFKLERRSLPAIALTTDTSVLTAISNDYDFKHVFRRQVEGLGQPGDVLIAISTSGNSGNVIEACLRAKEKGMVVVGFSGGTGGKMLDVCDHLFLAGSSDTPHIQEVHSTALHAVSEIVEDDLFRQ